MVIKDIDGQVLKTVTAESWLELDLRGCNLQRADFRRLPLTVEYPDIPGRFGGPNFGGAHLQHADFSGADISGARFVRAGLRDAKFDGAKLPWCQHDVITEILRQAAGDDIDKIALAGIHIVQRHWTWTEFMAVGHPLEGWALSVLARFVRPDEQVHPRLRQVVDQLVKA